VPAQGSIVYYLFTLTQSIMKAICFLIIIVLCSSGYLLGKIKNGYEGDLQNAKASLKNLNKLLLEGRDLTVWERAGIKTQIKNLVSYILYYELTEELLFQLQTISPVVFKEMDDVRDKEGRTTDVYVKLVPEEKAMVWLDAASFFKQSPDDEHANLSEYGLYTVSVQIRIAEKALFLLFHELGHIKYVVPNLASYSKFYARHYERLSSDFRHVGHNKYDQSGKTAVAFEKRFLEDQYDFLRNGGEKLESALSILQRIKRNYRKSDYVSLPRPAVYATPEKIRWE